MKRAFVVALACFFTIYPHLTSYARPAKRNGYVVISADPWALVKWTGGESGQIEVTGTRDIKVELKPGKYRFELRNDKFCSEWRTVTVVAGKTARVAVDFWRNGRTKIQLGGPAPCP